MCVAAELLVRGAAVLLVALVAGAFLVQRWLRDQAVDDHLAAARTQLAAGEFVSALEAVAKAQDKDPESSDAERLKGEVQTARAKADEAARREAALASAEAARAEARRLGGEAETLVAEVGTLRSRVEARRASVVTAYATTAERAAFARLENDLARKTVEAARLLEATREALERAARFEAPWGGRSDATNRAFADFYEARWNGVRAQGDVVQAAIYRDLVLEHDPAREAALLGRGTLTVSVGPAGAKAAEVYLFRYASYETVRADPPVVPRLVPVPTTGIGRAKDGAWVAFADGDAFYPGDLCLVVTSVADPSPAAEAGLRPGDLVVRLGGAPCGDGLFVAAVVPGGRAAKAGVRAGQRVEALDGVPVEGWYEWVQTPVREDADPPYRVDMAGTTVEGPHDRRLDEALGFGAAAPADLVKAEAPAGGLRLACLRGGVPVVLAVPEGVSSGLQVAVTAYPLVLAGGEGGNRVPADAPLPADPGSYLLLVRAPGFEDQRVPVVVERGGDAQADVLLRPAGSTPEGYVWVPPGPFVTGGDPDAFQSGPREVREGRGFLIARTEVTYGAWFEFVNDPETLAEIARAKAAGRTVVLPRDTTSPTGYAQRREDGTYAADQDEVTPVLGVSREDLDAFLAWRNRRAEADGEPWVYDLPTEWEWEQAARGADGRHYPWGDRFDPSLCVGLHRKAGRLYAEAPGFEPRDASPYGVLDLAGSRYEWTRDEFAPGSGTFSLRGGAWGYSVPVNFRCANRIDDDPSLVSSFNGFRLVVRPRPR